MDRSDREFNELLSNLIARVNKMLNASSEMTPIGLLLRDHEQIEVCLAAQDDDIPLSAAVQMLHDGMVARVRKNPALAACIAYPDYENEEVVVYLENTEHYCSKCRIPVSGAPSLHLDVGGIEVEDGEVLIFGEARA